jgi:hypothetical protein
MLLLVLAYSGGVLTILSPRVLPDPFPRLCMVGSAVLDERSSDQKTTLIDVDDTDFDRKELRHSARKTSAIVPTYVGEISYE